MTNRIEEAHIYVCDGCKRSYAGTRLTDGWYSYPPGWYVVETERTSLLVCGIDCANKFDDDLNGPTT